MNFEVSQHCMNKPVGLWLARAIVRTRLAEIFE